MQELEAVAPLTSYCAGTYKADLTLGSILQDHPHPNSALAHPSPSRLLTPSSLTASHVAPSSVVPSSNMAPPSTIPSHAGSSHVTTASHSGSIAAASHTSTGHLIMLPPSLLYHMCLLKCNKLIQGLQVQLVPKPSIGMIQAHHLRERRSGQRATRMCGLLHQVCQYSCLFAELTNYCYSVDPTQPPYPKPTFLLIIKSNALVSELLTLPSLSPPPPIRTCQWGPPLLKPCVPHVSSPLWHGQSKMSNTY